MNGQEISNEILDEFGYLSDKIREAEFSHDPFKMLMIDDFLSPEHFQKITTAKEINLPVYKDVNSLIEGLADTNYEVESFPGTASSINSYLKQYKSNEWDVNKELLERCGLVFRLNKTTTPILNDLSSFLSSKEFGEVLRNKFEITKPTTTDTGIQKYLDGYEISPHPDIRKKALTYMLNINTDPISEQTSIHTHLLKFTPKYEYIHTFWNNNDVERTWIPWNWCESVMETNLNNNIVIFSPSNDTLHAVKLDYDHLQFQRTQAYGNLWYKNDSPKDYPDYSDIDLFSKKHKKNKRRNWKNFVPKPALRIVKRFIR